MVRVCEWDDCEAVLEEDGEDPYLPEYIQPLICPECGERYLLDTETGNKEIDE